MDAVIARRVITDLVVVADKADCPKGYIVVPTKQNLTDTAENETGFEIRNGSKGRPRKKRFICIAYGLEELDEVVLTDLKILGIYEKVPASQEYTLLSKTRDTGEEVLEDKHLYLRWMKLSGYEWVIDTLMICPSTVSQGKRKDISGPYTRIGSVSNNMSLHCKKRCIYQASGACAGHETYSTQTEDIASDSPNDENAVEIHTVPTEKFQTEHNAASFHTAASNWMNSTLPPTTTVDKSRNVIAEDSNSVETKWQKVREMKKKDRRLSESSSDSVMASCGVKQDATGKSRKKKKKKKRSEQSSSCTETPVFHERPTEDPDPSLSMHMLSVSESAKRVTRSTATEAPPLPRGKMFHVFFSFRNSQNDKEWVRGIINKLESRPHCYSCCFADRDFIPGETVINNIEMAVKQSVRVAVVLTEEYIESYWCKYEATVIREPGSKACIIPLQLNNCRIPNSLKDLSFIPVSKDNDKWWETLIRALKGKIPYLPPTKSDHIFFFHGNSDNDVERIENLKTALEMCACSFRCISSGRDFEYGVTVKENVHMCAEKAATTVFALSKDFAKEKWLQHWQELSRKGFKLFPLMFDHFIMPKEFQDIVIFDATREQHIWLPRLIDNLMK